MRTPLRQRNFDRLVTALRSEMPPRFRWDFTRPRYITRCGSAGCALGLAREIGISFSADRLTVANNIGITEEDALRIFVPRAYSNDDDRREYAVGYNTIYQDVTPQQVADKLEKLRGAAPDPDEEEIGFGEYTPRDG